MYVAMYDIGQPLGRCAYGLMGMGVGKLGRVSGAGPLSFPESLDCPA
jgi:hypothetical protein